MYQNSCPVAFSPMSHLIEFGGDHPPTVFHEADRFLALLAADTDVFCFQTFGDSPEAKKDPSLALSWHSSLAKSFSKLQSLNEHGAGVFVTVNQTDGKSRKRGNIVKVRAIFADFDLGAPSNLPLQASIVVETSPNRYQYYWLCDELSIEDFELLESGLVKKFGADKNCKDVSRVLRIPGFLHLKGEPFLTQLLESPGTKYTRQELMDAFGSDLADEHRACGLGRGLEALKSQIENVPPEDYETWIEVGMQIHHAAGGSDDGLALWNWWSSRSAKYDEVVCEQKWETFDSLHPKPQTVRSLGKVRSEAVGWIDLTDKGTAIGKSQPNIEVFLKHENMTIYRDEFADMYFAKKLGEDARYLDDGVLRQLHMSADRLGLRSPKDYFTDAIYVIGDRDKRHPVRSYLEGLVWDGEPRIHKWLSTYAGAAEDDYSNAVGELFLLAAVRRVRKPGVKYDNLLVLVGAQGCGKSSLARILASQVWFDDNLTIGSDPKLVIELTQGHWIIEFAELTGITKREAESVKSMLSRTHDSARMAYGRAATHRPRQCVFIGTTNSLEFLTDETGNRRFWPVEVGEVDLEALSRDRDQLWAEAAYKEASGAKLTLDPALWSIAAGRQRQHKITDPLEERLDDLVSGQFGIVPIEQLYAAIGLGPDKVNSRRSSHRQLIERVMARYGWEKARLRRPAGQHADAAGSKDNRCQVFVREDPDYSGPAEWLMFDGTTFT